MRHRVHRPCAGVRPVPLLAFLLLAGPAVALDAGDRAPDFALPGADGETYVLSRALEDGPVVLAWYPQAFTSGCTLECRSFREHGDRIRALGVRYFMASVDPVERNRRFARRLGADFPILSDADKAVARAYGVLHQDRFALRTNLFIGTDGTILAVERNVDPRTAAQDVVARLRALGIPEPQR